METASASDSSDRRGILILLPESPKAVEQLSFIQHMQFLGILWQPYEEYIVSCDRKVLNDILDPSNKSVQNILPLVSVIQHSRPQ